MQVKCCSFVEITYRKGEIFSRFEWNVLDELAPNKTKVNCFIWRLMKNNNSLSNNLDLRGIHLQSSMFFLRNLELVRFSSVVWILILSCIFNNSSNFWAAVTKKIKLFHVLAYLVFSSSFRRKKKGSWFLNLKTTSMKLVDEIQLNLVKMKHTEQRSLA